MGEKEKITEAKIKKLLTELKNKRDEFYKQKGEFEAQKEAFELYKQEEEAKLQEELKKKELEHQKQLEKEKIEVLNKTIEEAKEEIKKFYDEIAKEKKELEKKKLEIIAFENEKREFESLKNEKLKAFEKELNTKKEQILSEYQAKQAKKLEAIIKQKEEMFDELKRELQEKEEALNKKEGEFKQKKAWLDMKKQELELYREEIKVLEQEKVQEKLNYLNEKLIENDEVIEMLKSENESLKEKLEKYSEFDDIDSAYEQIKELKTKLESMKGKHEQIIKEKDETILELEEKLKEARDEYQKLKSINESMQNENMTVSALRNENEALKLEKESLEHQIKILKGELEAQKQKLESIYSEGKELELRVQEIINEPYFSEVSEEILDINYEPEYLDHIQKSIKAYGVKYPKRLIYAFHTALKCADFSPLTVLYGVSGTGKSELPKLYSYFGGFNFLAEAVQPTWDSPESMIGYFNTLENKFDATNITKFLFQVFLPSSKNPKSLNSQMNMILLDEMNLAHIELYFAEFLSKFEQRRGSKEVFLDIKLGTNKIYKLPLERNLLWIGTMNDDETTKSLSDKVLDRSYLINFPRPKELFSRRDLKKLDRKEFKYLPKTTWENWIVKEELDEELIEKLKNITNEINQILMPTGRAIGHRVWQSMEFYMQNHPLVVEYKDTPDVFDALKIAYEEQLVQKIMPKLRGIELYGQEKEVIDRIEEILINHKLDIVEDFKSATQNPYGQFIWNSANYIFKEI